MGKKTVFVFAIFFTAVFAAAAAPNVGWYASDPSAVHFTVSTADELAGFAQIVNGAASGIARDDFSGKTVTLARNVDLSRYVNWTPIGNYGANNRGSIFSGTFDGGGHVIGGLTINRPDADYQGLFGCIDSGGRVENLGLVGVNIRGGWWVGAVAGYVGVGSSVINSYSEGAVTGNSSVGGIAGVINGGSVSGSYSTAAIGSDRRADGTSVDERLGIITGHLGGEYIGGIAGLVFDNGSVTNCYSTGTVIGVRWVGGVAGYVFDNSSVSHSYSTGSIAGRDRVGGVAGGIIMGSSVTHCAALNPQVKSVGLDAWRVVGYIEDAADVTLQNNVAWVRIRNSGGNTKWRNKGLRALSGANISSSAVRGDRTIGQRFTESAGWTTEPGKLPGLQGKAEEMPWHLR